jgi:SAM-dependent methyltransferase
MSVFNQRYAYYYDLFYADKDYAGETTFVRDVIRRYASSAHSLLELGCGSARHAIEFARAGLSTTGIDRSPDMIARGRNRIAQELGLDLRDQICLLEGDATLYKSTVTFDAVVSLFHVVSYQATNAALKGIFQTAREALAVGGLFVFDFWYGPAVLTLGPQTRMRRVGTDTEQVIRIAQPTQDINRNVVEVNYTIITIDLHSGSATEARETHVMRYLFLPEIELIAAAAGFQIIETGEWLTGNPLHSGACSGYAALRLDRK